MVVDVVRNDLTVGRAGVGVGDVVAVVDRCPYRTIGGDRKAGAVAHAASEYIERPALGRDAHDRGPLGRGVPVFGRSVAGRAYGEVDGAVTPDRDALQRVCIGAAEIGAPVVRQARGGDPACGGGAVGVRVGGHRVALRDVQHRPFEGQTVGCVEPLQQY